MNQSNLGGKFLIATNNIKTGIFKNAVVYIHEAESGVISGMIVNKSADPKNFRFYSTDQQWNYPDHIRVGGPCEPYLGYIVHSSDYAALDSVKLSDTLYYTAGLGVIEDINRGTGPSKFMLTVGYCEWTQSQLQNEIDNGLWIVSDLNNDIIFSTDPNHEVWHESVIDAADKVAMEILDTALNDV